MKYFVIDRTTKVPSSGEPNSCYLVIDNWNDYSYQTLFDLYYFDKKGEPKKIGPIKIMEKGQTTARRVRLPRSPFKKLSAKYCSVGQEQSFYEELMGLPNNVREDILKSLRDCVYNPEIYQKFAEEGAMNTSLLRYVSEQNVQKSFRNILLGHATATPYHFQFCLNDQEDCCLDVRVKPDSTPPTNVHVLIGRNGVGKTRILSGIADELTNNKDSENSIGYPGTISFPNEDEEDARFANLVTIVFSAFDMFTPIKSEHVKGDIRYQYVGLKKFLKKNEDTEVLRFKLISELKKDFRSSLETCLTTQRKSRWIDAIKILNSDPIFSEYKLDERAEEDDAVREIIKTFAVLSSGHKITLLSITKIVELVDERTLVLIDEPETHLHPPLLASFTRALSNLLIHRNGVALIATHSPVVLQEIPKSCVTVVNRTLSKFGFERPEIETFAENVGTLTREVFRLEATESGFHKMINDHLKNNGYEKLLKDYKHQIGSEGRAIARAIQKNKEE